MEIQRFIHIFHNEDIMKQHTVPADFPESPKRISAIMSCLKDTDCIFHKVFPIRKSFLIKNYGQTEVRKWEANIQSVRTNTYISEDADILWSTGTLNAVRTAVNAAVSAVHKVLSETGSHAFCIVRPPGHHCFDVPAGFCIVNNVALAVKTALDMGRKRVAILDWDYHFGDGTVKVFLNDTRVMFASLHCRTNSYGEKTYPQTQLKGSLLAKMTHGRMFNIQWKTDDADNAAYAYAFQTVILPALRSFSPDIILCSAGYDIIEGDTLAGMKTTPDLFRCLASALTTLEIPIVCVLEGGYNPDLLAAGVHETIQGLLYGTTNNLEELACKVGPAHKRVVDSVYKTLFVQ